MAEEPPDAQTVCAGEGGAAAHARTAADGFIAVRRRRRRRRRRCAGEDRGRRGNDDGDVGTDSRLRGARRGTVAAARTDWTFIDDAAISHYPAHAESHRYRLRGTAMRCAWNIGARRERFFTKA